MDFTVMSLSSMPCAVADELGCYRRRVFVERLGWALNVTNGSETDQFDRAGTVYVIAREAGRIIGCARLLPTTGPYLLADVFPELLHGQPAPCSPQVWELSRFAAVDLDAPAAARGEQFSSPAAVGLLRASICAIGRRGGTELVTVSPLGVERLLRKAGFAASRFAPPRLVGCLPLFACRIVVKQPGLAAEADAAPPQSPTAAAIGLASGLNTTTARRMSDRSTVQAG